MMQEPVFVQNYDPQEYQKNEYGKVGFPFDVIKANKETYAEVFSEGSAALKDLLLHMWDNDIETIGCCIGHKEEPYYYKKSVFGEREISADEYEKHKSSGRYHCLSRDKRSYCYFKVNCDGDNEKLKHLSESIKRKLQQEVPALPGFIISAEHNDVYNCDTINIFLDYVPQKSEVERFFSAIKVATSQVLGEQTFVSNKENLNPASRKPSLNAIIVGTDTKKAAQITTQSNTHKVEHAPSGR